MNTIAFIVLMTASLVIPCKTYRIEYQYKCSIGSTCVPNSKELEEKGYALRCEDVPILICGYEEKYVCERMCPNIKKGGHNEGQTH